MTCLYATLGLAVPDLDSARQLVGSVLGAELEERYSDHLDGDYWNLSLPEGRVYLFRNYADEDGVHHLDTRPDLTVVVETEGLTTEQVTALMGAGAQLVSRDVF